MSPMGYICAAGARKQPTSFGNRCTDQVPGQARTRIVRNESLTFPTSNCGTYATKRERILYILYEDVVLLTLQQLVSALTWSSMPRIYLIRKSSPSASPGVLLPTSGPIYCCTIRRG